VIDVFAQMSARTRVVHVHLSVQQYIKKRHHVGRTVRADRREPPAVTAREHFHDARFTKLSVGAT
jgi:hypothetical protein